MSPEPDLTFLAHEIDIVKAKNALITEIELSNDPDIISPKKAFPTTPGTLSNDVIVLSPSRITTEFDALRFEAAAFTQLHIHSTDDDEKTGDTGLLSSLLISSPYNNPGHYLDLTTLDTANLLFAKALTVLKPVRSDYATAPYPEALNFPTIMELLRNFSSDKQFEWRQTTFYVVIFRSKLKGSIDNELLYKLDFESHREACESGGLLKYWFGSPNHERRNLATCFWRSREDARKGGLGPWHNKARAAGRELYDSIGFSTHRFIILDGAQDFVFGDWE
ncbi:hypothetical protein K469DRAFT_561425 [Zopfia rhizophila CBS 207.26]|uniref:Uncharacterized protein n=1 Tax=Zopfia rhizophila CBS 207.26 TaxID=1314779 RepID=A0A6A6EHT0_9PEZI|nr:hypothetical protein K469DRAFT_561425 [Zopfia rhizophila CBS 207.26]